MLQLEIIHLFQREIFSEVLSLDTWNHVIKEEDRQNLEQLLPKTEAQNHDDVVEYVINYLQPFPGPGFVAPQCLQNLEQAWLCKWSQSYNNLLYKCLKKFQ